MPFKSLAIVSVTTSDTINWPAGTLSCGPFYVMNGYRRYTDSFRQSIDVSDPAGMHVVGPDVYPFLGQFSAVVLWHWPNSSFIRGIKDNSSVVGGTKVGIACSFESINEKAPWAPIETPVWTTSKEHIVIGTDGKPVDYMETSPPGKNHYMACAVGQEAYVKNYISALEYVFSAHYMKSAPDFLFFDCLQETRYWGSATNAPQEDQSDYRNGWMRLIFEANGRLAPVWGHNPSDGYKPVLKARVDEFFGAKPVSAGYRFILGAVEREEMVGLGVDSRSPWVTHPAMWRQLAALLPSSARTDRIYVETARTGSSFALWHPGLDLVL